MEFDVRWEHICDADLEDIYGSLEAADPAIRSVEWQLARDPLRHSWQLSPTSMIRLAWVKPYRHFPAVYLSFSMMDDGTNRHCLMLRARPGNVPGQS